MSTTWFGRQRKWKDSIDVWKTKLLEPLVRVLAWLNVSPNFLTLCGVLCMVGFAFFIVHDEKIAVVFLITSVIFDQLDGALSRYTAKASDKGKFIDATADSVGFMLFMLGVVHAGRVDLTSGFLIVYFLLLLKIFIIFTQSINSKTNWHIHLFTGLWIFLPVALSYLLFIIDVLFNQNFFPLFALLLAPVLVVRAVFEFFQIIHTPAVR